MCKLIRVLPSGARVEVRHVRGPLRILTCVLGSGGSKRGGVFILSSVGGRVRESRIGLVFHGVTRTAGGGARTVVLSSVCELPTRLRGCVAMLRVPLPGHGRLKRILSVMTGRSGIRLGAGLEGELVSTTLKVASVRTSLTCYLTSIGSNFSRGSPFAMSSRGRRVVEGSKVLSCFPGGRDLGSIKNVSGLGR